MAKAKTTAATAAPVQTELFPAEPAPSISVVVQSQTQALATTDDYVPTGLEHMPVDGLVIPQLKLLQGISPELNEFDHLRRGMFFHSTHKEGIEVDAQTPLRFVPVHIRKRAVVFKPDADGGKGIITQSSDGVRWDEPNKTFEFHPFKDDPKRAVLFKTETMVRGSKLLQFDHYGPGSKPIATEMIEVIMILPDRLDLGACVFTFKKSSYKTGNEFRSSFITALPPRPLYDTVYRMRWVSKTNGKETWLAPVVMKDGPTEGELRDLARNQVAFFYAMANENKLVIDEDTAPDEDDAVNTEGRPKF